MNETTNIKARTEGDVYVLTCEICKVEFSPSSDVTIEGFCAKAEEFRQQHKGCQMKEAR